jgi:hypothetical protein
VTKRRYLRLRHSQLLERVDRVPSIGLGVGAARRIARSAGVSHVLLDCRGKLKKSRLEDPTQCRGFSWRPRQVALSDDPRSGIVEAYVCLTSAVSTQRLRDFHALGSDETSEAVPSAEAGREVSIKSPSRSPPSFAQPRMPAIRSPVLDDETEGKSTGLRVVAKDPGGGERLRHTEALRTQHRGWSRLLPTDQRATGTPLQCSAPAPSRHLSLRHRGRRSRRQSRRETEPPESR